MTNEDLATEIINAVQAQAPKSPSTLRSMILAEMEKYLELTDKSRFDDVLTLVTEFFE